MKGLPTLSSVSVANGKSTPERLLLAAPRGYCAGVDRAVQTVEHALDLHGAPVYVRKEIVHNKHVVEKLRERGAIFVDQETEVPEGATVVFSAHGVAPSVHENAAARNLQAIDATCPLVTKVHVEARKFAAEGYTIVLVGHAGHEEVEGTMGEAPESIVLIETEEDVDRLEVPEGETVVFSAHGVAPTVHANAGDRALKTIDATCPLVTKVHVEAKKFAAEGYTIVLIGHAGHEEVEGTMGEAPEHIVLIETEDDVASLEVADPDKVAFISQTTLSVDETGVIIARLREKFPGITGPRTDDICYATTNRQLAVKQMAAECDLVLVIGSQNSSNSRRLVDVAHDYGADAHLIDTEAQVRDEWLEGARVVGISSGASAPEELVTSLVDYFRARGCDDVSEFEVLREDVRFMLPKSIRQALAAGTA